MADWESKVQTAAAAVFGGKLYQDEAPDNVDTDYCVFSLVGGSDHVTLTGAYGMVNARVQFAIVAKRNAALSILAKNLRAAMFAANDASPPLKNNPLGPGFQLPSDDTTLKGRILEFSVWIDENAV